jgi:hypothetical protein
MCVDLQEFEEGFPGSPFVPHSVAKTAGAKAYPLRVF